MILAHYRGEWVGAQRAVANVPGCALGVRNGAEQWAQEHGFRRYWSGAFWDKYCPDLAGIRFFPRLSVRGCRVVPWQWHPTAEEPLLMVFMEPEDLDLSRYFLKPPAFKGEEIMRAMRADGWGWDQREGGWKYFHVDELEKVEGPPPEGAF